MKRIAPCTLAATALLAASLALPATLPATALADEAVPADNASAVAEAQPQSTDGEGTDGTATVTEGWTQLGTLEWKVDENDCFILRPLGGQAEATMSESLNFSSLSVNPKSFKVEGTIEVDFGNDRKPFSFYKCSSLKTVDLSGAKFKQAVSASYMFYGCTALESVKLPTGMKISNAENMFGGYYWADGEFYCTSLVSVDISGVDFSSASRSSDLFSDCTALETVDLSDTKLANADGMFRRCSSLKSIDLSTTKFDQAVDAADMFSGCTALESVKLPAGMKASSAGYMFSGCSSLKSVNYTDIDYSECTSTRSMFSGCSSLKSIDLSKAKFSQAVDAERMFSGCTALESVKLPAGMKINSDSYMFGCYNDGDWCTSLASVDFSDVDFSGSSRSQGLFSGCTALKTINLSGAILGNTRTGTDYSYNGSSMFEGANALASVDLTNADFSNASSISYLFYGCSSLKSIDLSKAKFGQAVDASYMFSGCTALESVKLPAGMKISNAKCMFGSEYSWANGCASLNSVVLSNVDFSEAPDATNMFANCTALQSVKFPSGAKLGNTSGMFSGCENLDSVDLSGADLSACTDTSSMFSECELLNSVSFAGADLSNVSSTNYMFKSCVALATADFSSAKFKNITNASGMFYDCSHLKKLDLAGFTPAGDVDTSSMFYDCSSLTQIVFPSDVTISLSAMDRMFSECERLKSLDMSIFNTSKITSMVSVFSGCAALTTLDLSSFDTSNVKTMGYMFSDCSKLRSIDLSSFNTGRVQYMDSMFSSCSNLRKLDLTSFDTSRLLSTSGMFSGCRKLKSLDLSSFDTSNVDDMEYMFASTFPTTVKLGSKFLFEGSQDERQIDMPDDTWVWNGLYSGYWISSVDGKAYAPTKVSSGVAATYTAEEAEDSIKFSDVASSTPHSADVKWLANIGVSTGWWEDDGSRTFRPYSNVVRADMAAFLYRLAGSPSYNTPDKSPFTDVNSETPHYKEICWLAAQGISTGWDLGNGKAEFRPYATVARADMAAFLYRLADSPDYEAGGKPFADCTSSTAHYKEVCWLASTGVSEGWKESNGTKTFRPFNTVARADMAAFLHRMSDKDLV